MLRPSARRVAPGILAVCCLSSLPSPVTAQEAGHPLDPLSRAEIWATLDVLRAADRVDRETGFSLVTLDEPPKAEVRAWREGEQVPRAAFVILKQGTSTYEAVVDLVGRQIMRWEEIPGVQPTWLEQEFMSTGAVVLEDERWVEALERRGVTDPDDIMCWGTPLGGFAPSERRIATVQCADAHGALTFPYSRVFTGLVGLVDADTKEILDIIDEGVVPMPALDYRYDDEAIGPHRKVAAPIAVEQPLGPGFETDGHLVRWQNWSFHHRVDPRVGLIISDVRYRDGDHERSVLYQGHLSEIFVPYMDASAPWYAFNFIDAGEYSAGGLAKPMVEGLDCPENAVLFDAWLAGDGGRPKRTANAACVFERYAGDIAWRHLDDMAGTIESRPRRDLVVRSIAVLGNYDYVFDWVFQQNGAIEVRAAATGISNVKAVAQELAVAARLTALARGDGGWDENAADAYGRFVAPNLVAVNHDHFFSFRLDLDVDGPLNSLQVDRLAPRRLPENHPRRSLWVIESEIASRESQAKLRLDYERPTLWRVVNRGRLNGVGYPTSYQLAPRSNAVSLLDADDWPQGRAGFVDYHLWATPYDADERYAAGTYPTLSEPGEGLPEWTGADRMIESTDIVLWYTLGMHHVVRAEDFPVMPLSWQAFEIRPFDFFDRNPALDLPRSP